MRVLAVGDSYLTAETMRRGLAEVEAVADVTYLQLDESCDWSPATESERCIREYAGTPDQVAERLDDIDVLLVHGAPVTDAVVEASSRLRLIGCARGGPVNVDLAAASERGVPVVITPGKNATAVAEQAIALMVMLARRFRPALRLVESGAPMAQSAFEGAEFFGDELAGATLGLVGYGQVGRRVAALGAAFGMAVAAYDPYSSPVEGVTACATLDELLARSRFVSLHARATSENVDLIDADALARMPGGSYLVNTARETLVDEAALDAALASGRLAGAGLDVVHHRSEPGRHPLLRHDNLVLLPHIGGATHQTLMRGVAMLADAVVRLDAGAELANVVNPDAGQGR